MARTQRDNETRESQSRSRHWQPRRRLEVPAAPVGWRFAWKRYLLNGADDTKNVMDAYAQGYEPATVGDLPSGFRGDVFKFGEISDAIRQGDLVLMKIPEEMWRERQAHYRELARNQEKAIAAELRKRADKRTRILDTSERSTSLGRRQPEFQED